MCDYFLHQMENFQGDLADIIRAGGPPITTTTTSGDLLPAIADDDSWQFSQSSDFGHPLLHDLDHLITSSAASSSSSFFTSSNNIIEDNTFCGVGINTFLDHKINDNNPNINHHHHHHQEIINNTPSNNSSNMFSRVLQISPNNAKLSSCESSLSSPRLLKQQQPHSQISSTSLISNDHHHRRIINVNNNSSKSANCLIENSGVQISSPRNTGMKRRKSQAKKVVCIPAPAPANSRPTGEIVPSDLWAWRKYGQKPIKGSPYPRGYYRCSSSKGCSARKQVERSRTDPNMLVITYTSEHNHPWPTQRNALAGSTRSQPSKNINNTNTNSPPPAPNSSKNNSPGSHSQKPSLPTLKEEQKETSTNINNETSPTNVMNNDPTTVKEEEIMDDKEMRMEDGDQFDEGFSCHDQSYRPAMPDSNTCDQDFFAELGELEGDPLNHLLFTQGFTGDEEKESNKLGLLDAFNFYDWTGNSNANITSDGDQAKKGL